MDEWRVLSGAKLCTPLRWCRSSVFKTVRRGILGAVLILFFFVFIPLHSPRFKTILHWSILQTLSSSYFLHTHVMYMCRVFTIICFISFISSSHLAMLRTKSYSSAANCNTYYFTYSTLMIMSLIMFSLMMMMRRRSRFSF